MTCQIRIVDLHAFVDDIDQVVIEALLGRMEQLVVGAGNENFSEIRVTRKIRSVIM
jgi:hypothetical protein